MKGTKEFAWTPAARLSNETTQFGDAKTTNSSLTSAGAASFGGTPEKMGQGLVEGSYSQAFGEASMFSLLTPQGAVEADTTPKDAAFKLNAQTLFAFGVSARNISAKILVFIEESSMEHRAII